jgi:oligosaccharide repeat unit polymerase
MSDFFKLIDNYYVYEAYLKVLNFFPNKTDYLYGSSLVKPLVFWIPRSIWEDKPEELTSFIGKLVYGHTKSQGYSTGMTITGEFYLNFGIYGVIFFSLLLGMITSFLINRLLITKKESYIMISLMFIIYFPHIVRGGISLTIISLIIFSLVFILFIKTSYLYKKWSFNK